MKNLSITLAVFVIVAACTRKNSITTSTGIPPAGSDTIGLFSTAPGSISIPGTFKVIGRSIIDPQGNEFIPVGANINTWAERTSYSEEDIRMIKTIWKFNIVRVTIRFNGGAVFAHLNATDLFLESYVNAFTSDSYGKRVVVMFEAHDFSGSYYSETSSPSLKQLALFWKRMAIKYKNNPYVWFNIMNEPGSGSLSSQWLITHESCIKAVREVDPDKIIICNGHNFGLERNSSTDGNVPDSYSALLTYGPQLNANYKNLVYSFHVYVPWNNSKLQMENYTDRLQAAGLAVLVGEYGVIGGGGISSVSAASYLVSVLEPRKIGRLVWHYVGWDGNNLVNGAGRTGTDLSRKDGEKPPVNSGDGTLTTLGNLVWEDTH